MTIEEALGRVRLILVEGMATEPEPREEDREALRLILGEVERLSGEVTGGRELVAATLYQANVTQGKLSEALIAAEARAKRLEDALRGVFQRIDMGVLYELGTTEKPEPGRQGYFPEPFVDEIRAALGETETTEKQTQ